MSMYLARNWKKIQIDSYFLKLSTFGFFWSENLFDPNPMGLGSAKRNESFDSTRLRSSTPPPKNDI